jgi:ABC-type transport system substrate-binding protein
LHASFIAIALVWRIWGWGAIDVRNDIRVHLSRRGLLQLALGATPPALGLAPMPAWAETPRYGGTLIMALDTDPPTVNPNVTTGVPDVSVGSLIYEALTRIDDTFQPVPSLAESWTVSPDNLTYTFKLIKTNWHDGTPFTSKDVKFTLENISAKYGAKFRAAASHIKQITAPDDATVVSTRSSATRRSRASRSTVRRSCSRTTSRCGPNTSRGCEH